jgi:protein gp37
MEGVAVECYAKVLAERWRSPTFFSDGFESRYFHPDRLSEPLEEKRPCGIFADSMSDLFAVHGVSREEAEILDGQVRTVLRVMGEANWHVFFTLTKAAKRMLAFSAEMPTNLWAGVSSPPDVFMGRELSAQDKFTFMRVALEAVSRLPTRVRWISLEPLSFDATELLGDCNVNWCVIGAGSSGGRKYQPDADVLRRTIEVLERRKIAVFYKGNLRASQGKAFDVFREDYPQVSGVNAV